MENKQFLMGVKISTAFQTVCKEDSIFLFFSTHSKYYCSRAQGGNITTWFATSKNEKQISLSCRAMLY